MKKFKDNETALIFYDGMLEKCSVLSTKTTSHSNEYFIKILRTGKVISCLERELFKREPTEKVNEDGYIEHFKSKTKPPHYPDAGGDDWIGFTIRHKVGALEFNIGKYILRHDKKNGKEDLLKAQEYLTRLIDSYE